MHTEVPASPDRVCEKLNGLRECNRWVVPLHHLTGSVAPLLAKEVLYDRQVKPAHLPPSVRGVLILYLYDCNPPLPGAYKQSIGLTPPGLRRALGHEEKPGGGDIALRITLAEILLHPALIPHALGPPPSTRRPSRSKRRAGGLPGPEDLTRRAELRRGWAGLAHARVWG